MKLVGNFMLLAVLMYTITTEAARPGKNKGMTEGQPDWKGKRPRTDENKATYAQPDQPRESREPKKQEKRQSTKDNQPKSFEEQLTEAVNNIKLIKQKAQYKYSEDSNSGKESSIKKTSDNGVAYRKKTNQKEEENIKEAEDIYEAVSKSNKGRKSSTVNKRDHEEEPSKNVRVKNLKPTIVEEDCPDKHVVSQTNKHKGYTKNSECEHGNSYQTSKGDYKLLKKQSKNKSHKKEEISKRRMAKKQDDDENIQEEDNRRTWKKQYKIKYEDSDDDDDAERNKMSRKQKHNEDKNNFEDFSRQKVTKYEEEDEENKNVQEEMKQSQSKYSCTCGDSFQEEEPVSSENSVEENNSNDEEEITVEEQSIETNGRINVEKRESTVQTKTGPEGLVTEQNNEIDNSEPSKEARLKVLKKYMLFELMNEEYQNDDTSIPPANIEDTNERPTKEESNSNLNTYMYIVEEEFKGRQIRYSVEEDNGDGRCSLSEGTDEVSL